MGLRFYEFQDFFDWIPIIKTLRELSNYVLSMNGNWYCPSAIILTSQHLDLSMNLTTAIILRPQLPGSPSHLWPPHTPEQPLGQGWPRHCPGAHGQWHTGHTNHNRERCESPSHDMISSDIDAAPLGPHKTCQSGHSGPLWRVTCEPTCAMRQPRVWEHVWDWCHPWCLSTR